MTGELRSMGWARFSSDPLLDGKRRATSSDREAIFDILSEARADGRLSDEEWETRSTRAGGVKRLGDIPELVEDVIDDVSEFNPATMSEQEIQAAIVRLQVITGPATPAHIQYEALRRFESVKHNVFVATTFFFALTIVGTMLLLLFGGAINQIEGPIMVVVMYAILYGFVRLFQVIYYAIRRTSLIEQEEKRLALRAQRFLERGVNKMY